MTLSNRHASNREAEVLTQMLAVKAATGSVPHCHVCSRLAAAATRGGMGPSCVMSQAETWNDVLDVKSEIASVREILDVA